MTTLAERAKGTPFAILYEPRATPDSAQEPGKRGPKRTKAQRRAIAKETPAERQVRQAIERLRKNPYSLVARSTAGQADITARIRKAGI